MVEEPGWAVEFARLKALGMRLLPVPRRADGPDLEVMAQLLRGAPAQALCQRERVPQPDRLLPDAGQRAPHAAAGEPARLPHRRGRHLQPHRARARARACARSTACSARSTSSGFAKILAPNWRVGFLAAHPSLIERLLDTKLLTTLTTPALLEKALALCIEQGQLRRHAERIKHPAGRGAQPQRQAGAERGLHALPPSRRACSAGWIPASTPTRWRSACWTRAICSRPARCSTHSASPAR